MKLELIIGVVGTAAGAVAAAFSVLSWLGTRPRQPFAVRRVGAHVVLTRTRRPTVQIRRTYIFGHSEIPTADNALTSEWRHLSRDQYLVLDLDVRFDDGTPITNTVSPHETLTVEYRRIWPWSSSARRYRRGQRDQAERDRLDHEGQWLRWNGTAL